MTIRRCTSCNSKEHKYKDCKEQWRRKRSAVLNLDVISKIIDLITAEGDFYTISEVRVCSKQLKSVVDNSIAHFITNGKGPTKLQKIKHLCKQLVIAQVQRIGVPLESQNSMTYCCIFASMNTSKHSKSNYWLFLTYGDMKYYEFIRKYPGASKEQFIRHKDMIWKGYTKGQKDVYGYMIQALWGTYFFFKSLFYKRYGPDYQYIPPPCFDFIFSKKRKALLNSNSDLSGFFPPPDS